MCERERRSLKIMKLMMQGLVGIKLRWHLLGISFHVATTQDLPLDHLFICLSCSRAPLSLALVLDWRKPQYLHIFQSLLQLTKPVIFGMFSLTFPVQNVTSVMLHLLEVISIICKVRFYCSQFWKTTSKAKSFYKALQNFSVTSLSFWVVFPVQESFLFLSNTSTGIPVLAFRIKPKKLLSK